MMTSLSGRRLIALATALFAYLAITVIVSHPTGWQTDQLCYIGLPIPFWEWGGFGGQNTFDPIALAGDSLFALVVIHFAAPVIEHRLRPHIVLQPQFHVAGIMLGILVTAIGLGALKLGPTATQIVLTCVGLLGPLLALALTHIVSIGLNNEFRLGNYLLLISAMILVCFAGIRLPWFDSALSLFQMWVGPLWVIWLVWIADVRTFFPEPFKEAEGDGDD